MAGTPTAAPVTLYITTRRRLVQKSLPLPVKNIHESASTITWFCYDVLTGTFRFLQDLAPESLPRPGAAQRYGDFRLLPGPNVMLVRLGARVGVGGWRLR